MSDTIKTPLRHAREQRSLKIQEVAAAVDIDPGNLSRIERGKQVASRELAEKLAKFFCYSVNEIQILYPERFCQGQQHEASAP